MQFKYRFQQVQKDKIPFIDIRITNKENNTSVNYRAMLDSGAFGNIFHSDIAAVLGINLDKIKEQQLFSGVEKTKRSMIGKPYFVELKIIQEGKSYNFDALVIFTDQIVDSGYGLLGRQSFFDQFDEVVFNFPANSFCLRKD